ncbi:hypothetical protein [Pseudactinotalea sp.]|uniref:hypothetical protein n=1 Tax=Pseudactinotalea sp. TaxID=1926260 RepID=UPI003B3A23CE
MTLGSVLPDGALIFIGATTDQPSAPEQEAEGADPVAEETTEPATTTEAPTTTEPTDVQTTEALTSEEPAAVDTDDYEKVDERTLAQIVKAPDDHIGEQIIVCGRITQLDAATGQCMVLASISHEKQSEWYDYEHNSVGVAGDGVSDCPVLDPFVEDDEVKLWITVTGSISYDTQIGGNTTVPSYIIGKAELV